MNKVLLIGENPNGPTGNGLMMSGVISQIPIEDHEVSVFCPVSDFAPDPSVKSTYALIPAEDLKRQDAWGRHKLLAILDTNPFDFVVMVGIDIWRYIDIIQHVKQIQQRNKFKLIHIFPYDLQYLDKEFVQYANLMDQPCVYSEYGYYVLNKHIPNLRYYRPFMTNQELFFPYDDEGRTNARASLFPTVSPDTYIFGFIGPNQIRKDPQKLIKAFAMLKAKVSQKIVLYLHTDFQEGVYNLQSYAMSCGLDSGDLLVKPSGSFSPFMKMPDIFNSFDCFVNCSMQEGLSWTTIQAMMCGIPVIASKSTAHIELLKDYPGTLVECNQETYLPIKTTVGQGQRWIDTLSCSAEGVYDAMFDAIVKGKSLQIFARKQRHIIEKWVEGCSKITDLFQKSVNVAPNNLMKAILFIQHSAAGDILMTTRCLKRIREKHGNLPLHYMTQEKFFGLLDKNPDVAAVVPWNLELRKVYQVVYNPHGEHILRGGFNNLDVKLADMYPYFCKVQPDDFFIDLKKPERIQLTDTTFLDFTDLEKNPYIVVHTTGGDPVYRTYAHMSLVIKGLKLPVIQIGGNTDLYCQDAIDLRGILSFTETAWVMKHATTAIVIDSFPSHLAGAVGTPAIVLYGPAPARVVGPVHTKVPDNLWFDMEPNKLDVCPDMTNCHGQKRNCQSPCINSINPYDIRDNLIKILSQVVKDG